MKRAPQEASTPSVIRSSAMERRRDTAACGGDRARALASAAARRGRVRSPPLTPPRVRRVVRRGHLDGALRLCVAEPLREVVEVLLARVDEAQHHRVETEGPHLGRAWPALLLSVPVVAQQDVGGARRDETRPLEVGGALGGCSLPRAFAGELLPSPVLVINLPLVEPRWLKAHAAHLAFGGAKGLRVLLGAVLVHVGAAARLRAARLEADNTGGFRLSLGHRYADRNALRRCLRGHRRGWWRGRRRGLSRGQLARWFSVGMRDRGAW
mmetsp:Transcript_16233/g.48066  ORF Transcript_16233/g.48066 Transcript_16233/m.48066 type:complete len:268 (-) Transcript_16233:28-831(-)